MMLMNFSPLGLLNRPTYQTLDEVETEKEIEEMENNHAEHLQSVYQSAV